MIVVCYLHFIPDPLAREVPNMQEACRWMDDLGEDRLDRVIICDISQHKQVDKEELRKLVHPT